MCIVHITLSLWLAAFDKDSAMKLAKMYLLMIGAVMLTGCVSTRTSSYSAICPTANGRSEEAI